MATTKKKTKQLPIPAYIGDILYEVGGIKGAWLHGLVEEAIRKDGKVPTKDQWLEFVDATSDELCPLECQEEFPETAEVLMNFFIP